MAGMFKEELKVAAAAHHKMVWEQYAEDIYHSEGAVQIYYKGLANRVGQEIQTAYTYESTTNVQVLPLDTVSAIDSIELGKRISVLNFASYKNPGGMFLEGSKAQEESLCHASILYEVLKSCEDFYYKFNRCDLNYGMYRDIGIYSRDLLFLKPRKRYVDVMTCAAPNMNALRYHEEKRHLNPQAVYNRCAFVLDCMYKYEPDVVILGAFGCGVFKQDPGLVARAFHEALHTRYFKQVIFAIPDANSRNFKEFVKEFES